MLKVQNTPRIVHHTPYISSNIIFLGYSRLFLRYFFSISLVFLGYFWEFQILYTITSTQTSLMVNFIFEGNQFSGAKI